MAFSSQEQQDIRPGSYEVSVILARSKKLLFGPVKLTIRKQRVLVLYIIGDHANLGGQHFIIQRP